MEQTPISLNFTESGAPFPKGEILVTQTLGTYCVKPRKELSDLKIDSKNSESHKDLIQQYIHVKLEGFTTGKNTDRRKDVDTVDAPNVHKEFPFSAICSLDIFFENSVYVSGTGFMIGSRYILTAAHNLYQTKYGTAKNVFVTPGRRRDQSPFGVHKVTHAFLFTNVYKGTCFDDMAVAALDCEIGDYTGWFGMADLTYEDLKGSSQENYDGFSLRNRVTHVCGYEPPKFLQSKFLLQSLKIHSGDLVDKTSLSKMFKRDDIYCYDIDTVEGQSGSPVWVTSGQNVYAVGVHNNFAEGQSANIAARLTREKIIKICEIIGKQEITLLDPFNSNLAIKEAPKISEEALKKSFQNPFTKAPKNLEEVLEQFKKCNSIEEKNLLIEYLTSYKHYKLSVPLQKKTDIFEGNSMAEVIKDFQVTCKIFKRGNKESLDCILKHENLKKEIQEMQAWRDQDKIECLSFDFKNSIDYDQFDSILKMFPKIPKLHHLDIKINLSNKLNLADLLSKAPSSEYFDLYVKQTFDEHVIQKCSDILNSILKKNPKINLYMEFEFDKFEIKAIDHTILKISNSKDFKKDVYPLEKGFCVLVNDPSHKITESNMHMSKSIFRCFNSIDVYEKHFRLLGEMMNEKKFIQLKEFGEVDYFLKIFDRKSTGNIGNQWLDQSELNSLVEVSMNLREDQFNYVDVKFLKFIVKKLRSFKLSIHESQSKNKTISEISELIKESQKLRHFSLIVSECTEITDAGLKTLANTLQNLKSDLLTLSLDFNACTSIKNPGIKSLSQSIQFLSSLSNLALDFIGCIQISDEGMFDLSQSIQNMYSLSCLTLKFGWTGLIKDAGLISLSQSIQKMSNISNLTLDLSGCESISDYGIKKLAQCVKNLSNLCNLTLLFYGCKLIGDAGIKELSQSIQNLSGLSNISFDFRECKSISDSGMNALSKSIKLLPNLSSVSLDFRFCDLVKEGGIKVLSESMISLPNLSYFTLNGSRKDF